jgi:hypothetical protein
MVLALVLSCSTPNWGLLNRLHMSKQCESYSYSPNLSFEVSYPPPNPNELRRQRHLVAKM